MQEIESLKDFMKWFEQVVFQVESYNMDPILQIFKKIICLGTSFFESLAKKSLATMDNLFKRANKHFLLGDYIRVDYSAGLGHQSSDQERPCKKL